MNHIHIKGFNLILLLLLNNLMQSYGLRPLMANISGRKDAQTMYICMYNKGC